MKISKFTTFIISSLFAFIISSVAMAGGGCKLKVSNVSPDIPPLETQDFNIYDDNNFCMHHGGAVYSVASSLTGPLAGALDLDANFASNGQFSFTNDDGNGAGFLTTDKNDYVIRFRIDCGHHGMGSGTVDFKPYDSSGGAVPPPPPPPATPGVLSLSFDPNNTTVTLADNASMNWTAIGADGTTCPATDAYTYSLTASPNHGTVILDAGFATNGKFTYANDGSGGGYLGGTAESIIISVACGSDTPASQDIQLSEIPSVSCSGSNSSGVVIIDNTSAPGQAAITTNLAFLSGCGKGDTTIDDGYGGNAINITDFETVNRRTSRTPHVLDLVIGNEDVDDNRYGSDEQQRHFAEGEHLFDLDRLRAVADWISTIGNVVTALPDHTYGTISFEKFLDNVANARTMYGMVRVKIPLKKGQRSSCGNDCDRNSIGETGIVENTIYGFCDDASGLCSCSPTSGTNLKEGKSYCGHNLTSSSRVKVKGSLLWDFVDHLTGDPIPLRELPFAPRELYFKVTVPIMVNWDHDEDDDGAMDNMFIIKAVSNGESAGPFTPSPAIMFKDIPQSSKDAYLYQTGNVLDQSEFSTLNNPNKYHLLMASGYADGWADAFTQLGITAETWASIPTATECANYTSTTCTSSLGIPSGVSGIMTANDVRNSQFEDIPAYLYSGGLIDMHGHVNISGLLYVPQAMELEAKDSNLPTQQYVVGAILVRDGFYIEAKSNTITVISQDPNSYSTARTSAGSSGGSLSYNSAGPGGVSPSSDPSPDPDGDPGSDPDGDPGNGGGNNGGGAGGNANDTSCIGCSGQNPDGSGSGGSGIGANRWVEIRPQ